MRPTIQLLTISREFGAGGSDLARELGRRLGWPVLDQEIVHRVADRLRVDTGIVVRFDEHAPSMLARIASALVVPHPEGHILPRPGEVPDHDAIAAVAREVILSAAEELPLIVVGHGGQVLFHEHPAALHVRLVAPPEVRAKRIAERLGIPVAQAAEQMRRADQDRLAYVQRYYQQDWRDPLLYDLQLNTGRMSLGRVAEVVERAMD